MKAQSSNLPTGSQTIDRAFSLLRIVAEACSEGVRLTDIAARAGLHVATAHRLLGALVRQRAVSYDPYARVYHIGYDFLRREEDTEAQRVKRHFHGLVERLADSTGEVVYLYIRHGLDALCVDAASGVRVSGPLTLGEGGRRPLGIGAGSVVLLASLLPQESTRALNANDARFARYAGITERQIKSMVRTFRRDGYVFHPGYVLSGFSGVGVALFGQQGEVVAAVSVAAPNERMTPDRLAEIVRLLKSEGRRAGPLPEA